jgi:hypothetical protein
MLPFRCCSVLGFSCLFSASALVTRGAGPPQKKRAQDSAANGRGKVGNGSPDVGKEVV